FPQGETRAEARADAHSEAQAFLTFAAPAPGDLIPVLDLERTNGFPSGRLIVWAQTWLDSVRSALGVQPLIYTGPHFWETNMADTTTFAEQGFPLWIAHWTGEPAPRTPAANWAGNGWSFWQWTNCAEIPGIDGCVDEDKFPGSDLSPFVIPGAPEPEPTPDPAVPPSPQSAPTISGNTEVGSTLTATSGTWNGSEPLSYSYVWWRCASDGTGCDETIGTAPTYELVPADFGHRMKVTVTATNSAGSSSQDSEVTEVVTDTTPPQAPRMRAPRREVTLSPRTTVRWDALEPGATYDVRYRNATARSGFGDHIEVGTGLTSNQMRIGVGMGTTFCFSARATDTAGNVSGWSRERCTTTPLDERKFRARGDWDRVSGAEHYLGTLLVTTDAGARLSGRRVRMRTIELVARRCPGCGRVTVFLNSTRLATISLRARRTVDKQRIHVTGFGRLRRGTIRIVTRDDKPVGIDGVVFRR
ncbi:MAG: GH25 family lysozyme, partial [Actinomycetota bacterium]